MSKPHPPYIQYSAEASLNLDDLAAQVLLIEEQRQQAFDLGRQFASELRRAQRRDPHHGSPVAAAASTSSSLNHMIQRISQLNENISSANSNNQDEEHGDIHPRTPRLANLSARIEDLVRHQAFLFFLETGLLLPLSTCNGLMPIEVTDEEYLAGACMGLAMDLQRYGLGRATARDVRSVEMACELVAEIHQYLLGLDFRNGPLRRKFDCTKYALKGLETLLYELAVTGANNDDGSGGGATPVSKRPRLEGTSDLLPLDELLALQKRMIHRDELRESLIKQCRDGQKAAKQSIFALHRGDKQRAEQLLRQCHTCITQQLLPIAKEEPPLRMGGSLAGVMEEYAEAKLFAVWLYGPDMTSESPSGIILQPQDFDVELKIEEYIGGLCDLTGEIGRYAVQRGTARDVEAVKRCLQTNNDIWYALDTMERLPQGIGKKMDALRNSVEKLERMLYELSLSAAAGGREVKSNIGEPQAMEAE